MQMMQTLQILLEHSIFSPFILRIYARTLAPGAELSETHQKCPMQMIQMLQVAV
jgi:hypothetical protein